MYVCMYSMFIVIMYACKLFLKLSSKFPYFFSVCMYVFFSLCMYVFMYVCMYVCVCLFLSPMIGSGPDRVCELLRLKLGDVLLRDSDVTGEREE